MLKSFENNPKKLAFHQSAGSDIKKIIYKNYY